MKMSLILLLCLSPVLMNLVATSSDVCKVVTAKNGIFLKGKRLMGFQFYRITIVPDVIQCARNCFFRRRCLSFNYNENTEICEFNNARVDSQYTVLHGYSDYLYSDIDDWDESIGMGPCWNRPCAICEACYPTESNYTCVKEELTSCRDIKICTNASSDDHYLVRPMVGTKPWLKIYCHTMSSNYPQEFLTLLEDNFSVQPPLHYLNCSSVNLSIENLCSVYFQKIRLDITVLEVITTDKTFTNTSCDPKLFGISDPLSPEKKCVVKLDYGSAADCLYDTCYPRKGTLKIDLQGTGLTVSPLVKWKTWGYKSRISSSYRSLSNEVIKIVCGGNCGGCNPDGSIALEPKS